MSGGWYNYAFVRVDDFCSELRMGDTEELTLLRQDFRTLLRLCAKAMKDIEWVDSGDCGPGYEIESIKQALALCGSNKPAQQDSEKE